MANYLTKLLKGYGPDRVLALARFITAGTGAPTPNELNGVVSIARISPGLFRVTLQESAKDYHVVGVRRQGAAALAAANDAVVTAVDATAKTIDITVFAIATGAVADTTALTVALTVLLRRSN